MKRKIINTIFLYFILGTAFTVAQNGSLNFNFTSSSKDFVKNYNQLDSKTIYTDSKKFGLLSENTEEFSINKKWNKVVPHLSSGIKSYSKVEFKSKILPGEYYVEITMDGGNTGHWIGEISVNNLVIVDELYSFTTDPESDEAPDYWSIIRKIKIESNEFLFSVKADNQQSSLSSLSLIPVEESSLRLVNGKVIADKNFFAPNSKLIIDLINKGAVDEALRLIDAIPEVMFGIEKAKLLIATAGRLETKNPRQLIENANRILNIEKINGSGSEIDLKITELYSYADQSYKSGGWDWTKNLKDSGIFNHINFSGMAFDEIIQFEDNPINIRAMYELAKVTYWVWVEQHTQHQIDIADKYFKKVQKFYPDNKILKMYLGERLFTIDYPEWNKEIPEWAYLQKKAMNGVLDIIHYWVENRQADNGEFGGKYDDDVEMLRWWPVSRTVVDDSIALKGMQRLVDGIWDSKWITNGWSRKLRDVEHSSEPIADTQPMMIGFDYGNPIYVERCMATVDKLDLWTGINSKGHRHFKASWYSSTAIDTTAPKDCDVEMNTRTVKAINWLAWYNRHPVALKFLREWSDSWLEDCMRAEKGKPRGIVPAAIRFADDEISGYSDNWYQSGMFWHYYDFRGGSKMLDQFLVSYLLFEDEKYLEPLEIALDLVQKNMDKDLSNSEPGSEEWTASMLLNSGGFAEATEIWRLITGNNKYDELIKKIGSYYIKFRLTGNEETILDGLNEVIDGTYNNRELNTTEAYFTDRVEIRDFRGGNEWGATHLESMFTGSPMLDTFYPFNPISWRGFGKDFSALVLNASTKNIKIKIVNLANKKIDGSIVFHQLENGKYKFQIDSKGSSKIDHNKSFDIKKRNSELNISIAALDEIIIEINQIEKYKKESSELADLAITKSELKIVELKSGEFKVSIPVHNIGIVDAEDIEVSLYEIIPNGLKNIETKLIKKIKAPFDLIPKTEAVEFEISSHGSNYEISVDKNSKIEEITTLNNKIIFSTTSN